MQSPQCINTKRGRKCVFATNTTMVYLYHTLLWSILSRVIFEERSFIESKNQFFSTFLHVYLSKCGLDLFWSSSIRWKLFVRLLYFYFFLKAFLRVWWKYDLTSKQNFYSVQINLALFVLTFSVQKVFPTSHFWDLQEGQKSVEGKAVTVEFSKVTKSFRNRLSKRNKIFPKAAIPAYQNFVSKGKNKSSGLAQKKLSALSWCVSVTRLLVFYV